MSVLIRSLVLANAIQIGLVGTSLAGELPSYNDVEPANGWYFYQEPEDILLVIPEVIPPSNAAENDEKKPLKEDVVINSKWLRENLPKLQEDAQDNPTYENVRRFIFAQRIALDISSKFASVYS